MKRVLMLVCLVTTFLVCKPIVASDIGFSVSRKAIKLAMAWPIRAAVWSSLMGLSAVSTVGVYMFYENIMQTLSNELFKHIIYKYMHEHHVMRLIYLLYSFGGFAGLLGFCKTGGALWDGPGRYLYKHCCKRSSEVHTMEFDEESLLFPQLGFIQ